MVHMTACLRLEVHETKRKVAPQTHTTKVHRPPSIWPSGRGLWWLRTRRRKRARRWPARRWPAIRGRRQGNRPLTCTRGCIVARGPVIGCLATAASWRHGKAQLCAAPDAQPCAGQQDGQIGGARHCLFLIRSEMQTLIAVASHRAEHNHTCMSRPKAHNVSVHPASLLQAASQRSSPTHPLTPPALFDRPCDCRMWWPSIRCMAMTTPR